MTVEQPGARNGTQAKMFVRPHELEIIRAAIPGSIPAKVVRVQAAGPQVRVELSNAAGHLIQADISHAEFRELRLNVSDNVFVCPRQARVFVADYSI